MRGTLEICRLRKLTVFVWLTYIFAGRKEATPHGGGGNSSPTRPQYYCAKAAKHPGSALVGLGEPRRMGMCVFRGMPGGFKHVAGGRTTGSTEAGVQASLNTPAIPCFGRGASRLQSELRQVAGSCRTRSVT